MLHLLSKDAFTYLLYFLGLNDINNLALTCKENKEIIFNFINVKINKIRHTLNHFILDFFNDRELLARIYYLNNNRFTSDLCIEILPIDKIHNYDLYYHNNRIL